MSVYYFLVLIGLLVEIIACFILSVEAIGLDRVAKWVKSLSILKRDISEEQKEDKAFSRGKLIGASISGVGSMAGVYLVVFLLRRYSIDFESLRWYQTILAALGGGIAGAVFGVSLFKGVVYGLSFAVFGLLNLEARTRARSSGVLGFLLLFLGFVMQFAGTLGQGLSK